MAAVFKSMLVAAALMLVGIGAAGAVWAEPVSANRVIPDPLVKHRPNYVDPSFSDAAKSAVARSAKAAVLSAKAVKGSVKERPSRFLGSCGNVWKRQYAPTTRPCPDLSEHYRIDVNKTSVPLRLSRPQYPRGYQPGFTAPSPHSFGSHGEESYFGDFWQTMYRAARASNIAK